MSWIARAHTFLMDAHTDGAWGYRVGGQAFAEPTALVALAQRVHDRDAGAAARWLGSIQETNGAVPIQKGRAPHWPTPLALLAWLAIGGFESNVKWASQFLLGFQGKHWSGHADYGHDTAIVGWPWVEGTHSWVEPTSHAVCALIQAGYGNTQRVASGRALLLDRVTQGGGWNYGNTTVLGSALPSYVAPTGIALLATLPALAAEDRIQASAKALEAQVQQVRSPISLAWSLLGLEAAGRRPDQRAEWLEESFARMEARGPRVRGTALLLLAARADVAVRFLGAGGLR